MNLSDTVANTLKDVEPTKRDDIIAVVLLEMLAGVS
jgi:hypothetical protein